MDDLKSQQPVSQAKRTFGDQGTIPQPTPPEPAPTAPLTTEPEKPTEPTSTIPTSTVTTQTASTESQVKPSVSIASKPSGKKISSSIKIGGALVILLMAATLPATIILVQNKTTIAPKAEEGATTPTPIIKPIRTAKTFIALTKEEQESFQAEPIKPRNLEIEATSSGSVKITFSTQGVYLSLIRYSPDEDWNYLTMLQEGDVGDEWQERYHPENQVNVEPVGGKQARTEHEFFLEGLVVGQKYYFVIEIEVPEENTVYLFGLEQPENYYIFIAE